MFYELTITDNNRIVKNKNRKFIKIIKRMNKNRFKIIKYSENINKYRNSIFLNRCGKAIAIKPGTGKKEH